MAVSSWTSTAIYRRSKILARRLAAAQSLSNQGVVGWWRDDVALHAVVRTCQAASTEYRHTTAASSQQTSSNSEVSVHRRLLRRSSQWTAEHLCILYLQCQFTCTKADRISNNLFQANNCFCLKLSVFAEHFVKLHYFLFFTIYFSQHYKVEWVQTSGEVGSFNMHYSAFIAVAMRQIWWKFVNNF